MAFTAAELNPPLIQPWNRKRRLPPSSPHTIPEPLGITVPQVLTAANIMPLLPTLPPINHS
jgi:hypothetical protein